MKKLTMILVTVVIVAGLAGSALADPGWSNGQRYGNHGRFDRPQYNYNNPYHQGPQRYPVMRHRVLVRPPEPVVRVFQPHPPAFGFFFPNFSIQVH